MILYWTQDRVIAAMRGWHDQHGKAPAAGEWVLATVATPNSSTVLRRFGTWNNALRAAGLPVNRDPDDNTWRAPERTIRALQEWADLHGAPPRMIDWKLVSDRWPHRRVVERQFGTWNNALRAAGLPVRISSHAVHVIREAALAA